MGVLTNLRVVLISYHFHPLDVLDSSFLEGYFLRLQNLLSSLEEFPVFAYHVSLSLLSVEDNPDKESR